MVSAMTVILVFLLYISDIQAAFSHVETGGALRCTNAETLVPIAANNPVREEACVCRDTWSLNEYNITLDDPECDGELRGCDHNCLGGGWCPVINPFCSTSEDRKPMLTQ